MRYEVTIGIPVYEVGDRMRQSLESALAQTCPSVEFLLVDDAGKDGSMDIVRDLQRSHPRGADIRIVAHEVNRGVAASRNDVIREAQGEYLYFMDADDKIEEGTIALLLEHARRRDADVVFGSYEKVELTGERQRYCYPSLALEGEDRLATFAYERYGRIQASACNCLMRLSLLRENGLRFLDASFWEDFAFMNELVTCVGQAVLLPDVTYYYCCREGSLSHYQQRSQIAKDEVLRNAWVVGQLKKSNSRLREKPYYPNRCRMLAMTDFYIVRHVLKRRKNIVPRMTNGDLKAIMNHPASLREILSFRQQRLPNLLLYGLGRLPAWLMATVVSVIG